MKFLKLNESYANGDIKLVVINAENILTFKLSDRGTDTHIYLKSAKYIFVKESVDKIWDMLHIDNTRGPVLMTAEEYGKMTKGMGG